MLQFEPGLASIQRHDESTLRTQCRFGSTACRFQSPLLLGVGGGEEGGFCSEWVLLVHSTSSGVAPSLPIGVEKAAVLGELCSDDAARKRQIHHEEAEDWRGNDEIGRKEGESGGKRWTETVGGGGGARTPSLVGG
jgi:hypothetical protein